MQEKQKRKKIEKDKAQERYLYEFKLPQSVPGRFVIVLYEGIVR